jgi:heme exporter protein A
VKRQSDNRLSGGLDIPLQACGLIKDYGHRSVLREIDMQVSAGELIGLMGANGAGKTTLLGCLASIIRPTTGCVRWFGHSHLTPSRRRWIGMVSHESRLYGQLTLQENLVFAARIYGVRDAVCVAQRQLARVGLSALGRRLPGQVSRGMCQRIAIARALLHEPSILLLDEPFSGLDQEGVEWLTEVLQDLKKTGRAICVVTHDALKLRQLADKIWQIQGGRLLCQSAEDASEQRTAGGRETMCGRSAA